MAAVCRTVCTPPTTMLSRLSTTSSIGRHAAVDAVGGESADQIVGRVLAPLDDLLEQVRQKLLMPGAARVRRLREKGFVADGDDQLAVVAGNAEQIAHHDERHGGEDVDEIGFTLFDSVFDHLLGQLGDALRRAAHTLGREIRQDRRPEFTMPRPVGERHHLVSTGRGATGPEQRPAGGAEGGRVGEDAGAEVVAEHGPDGPVERGFGAVDGSLSPQIGDDAADIGPGPEAGIGQIDGGGGHECLLRRGGSGGAGGLRGRFRWCGADGLGGAAARSPDGAARVQLV